LNNPQKLNIASCKMPTKLSKPTYSHPIFAGLPLEAFLKDARKSAKRRGIKPSAMKLNPHGIGKLT
jgi:hypothetical protein